MRLRSFRVCGFRCIKDSGSIAVKDLVALVGRNESGKTALLQALQLLNKDSALQNEDLTDGLEVEHLGVKTFPPVVEGSFELSEDERTKITKEFPSFPTLNNITIVRRRDSKTAEFEMPDLPDLVTVVEATKNKYAANIQELIQLAATPPADLAAAFAAPNERKKAEFGHLINQLSIFGVDDLQKEHSSMIKSILDAAAQLEKLPGLAPTTLKPLQDLQKHLKGLFKVERGGPALANFINENCYPRVVYFSSYKAIHGNVRLADYETTGSGETVLKLDTGESLDRKETVENLFYLSGLDPKQLNEVAGSPTKRSKYLGDCARNLTKEIQRGWISSGYKIECDLDFSGGILSVKVVNVNDDGTRTNQQLLQRRSEGFRWQFSFQVNFKAETKRSALKEAILLLDEPGLHLHPAQQEGLLKIIQELARDNQILYTTHSPFMIFDYSEGGLLLVEIDAVSKLSKVTADFWNGSQDAIIPVLHSLGAKAVRGMTTSSQTANVLPPVLIVEGTTDSTYIKAINYLFRKQQVDGTSTRNVLDVDIAPANGSSAIRPTALFHQRLGHRVVALYDDEPDSRTEAEKLIKAGFPEQQVLFVQPQGPHKKEADIEDMFTEAFYLHRVNGLYSSLLLNARFAVIETSHLKAERESNEKLIRMVPALELVWAKEGKGRWGDFSKASVCDHICSEILTSGKLDEKLLKPFDELFGRVLMAIGLPAAHADSGAKLKAKA